MGYSIGPDIITADRGTVYHVEISNGRIWLWEPGELAGLAFSYEEALKLAKSIRLHLEIYTDMEID